MLHLKRFLLPYHERAAWYDLPTRTALELSLLRKRSEFILGVSIEEPIIGDLRILYFTNR